MFLKRALVNTLHSSGFDIVRIHKGDHYFPELQKYPIRSVIDIGANRGQFAKKALAAFPNAQLYCFEPIPETFQGLEGILKPHRDRVQCFNVALGEKTGSIQMFLHRDHDDSSSFLPTTDLHTRLYPMVQHQTAVPVSMITLDQAMEHTSLRPEILVKLDVQGYEDRVIAGGRKTLAMARACIAEVCLDSLYERQATFNGIVDLLDQLGFRYAGNVEQVRDPTDGHVIYIDTLFLK